MSYMLKHTAEELDLKLDLIDENKNLLPYPYVDSGRFPACFEDVGDGSILTITPGDSNSHYEIELKTVGLTGAYKVSLDVVDILETSTKVGSTFALGFLDNEGTPFEVVEQNNPKTINFPAQYPCTIKLISNGAFDANLLIKPMIRKADTTADWVPNMDKIGTYVDRRFNNTNAKIKVLAGNVETQIEGLSDRIDNLTTGGEGGGGNANVEASTNNAVLKWNSSNNKIVESKVKVDNNGSVILNDGTTTGSHSIVGGTADKSVISNIIGSLAAASVKLSAPTASADCAISIGSGNIVNSTGGAAVGVWNTSGVKGYYWRKITFNSDGTATITLSSEQDSNSNVSTDWKVDDTISIVNGNKYPACTTIKSVNGSTITVYSLPFTSETSVLLKTPDDNSIFACYRKKEVDYLGKITNYRWYPRNGAVELGWAGTAFGVENLVTGSGAFTSGWNNWAAGDFGATFGRDNITGYAGLTSGYGNTNKGTNSAAFGLSNTVDANNALVAGQSNTINRNNAAVFGYNNTANAASTFIAGDGNTANVFTQAVVGRYCNPDETGAALFVVGNGENKDGTITRSNAFLVHTNGTITASMIRTARNNTISGSNSATFGENNTVSTPNSAIIGKNNNVSGHQTLIAGSDNKCVNNNALIVGKWNQNITSGQGSQSLMAGIGLTMGSQTQTVLGQYNQARTSKVLVIGWGTGNDSTGVATEAKTICTVNKTSKLNTNSAVNGGAMSNKQYYSTPATPSDVITYGWLMNDYTGGSGTGLPDCSGYQDGAILVVRNGKWVIENPPTTVYTGEVE